MVVLGFGSYGLVLAEPRITIENENYSSIIKLNQVSKILYKIDENNNYISVDIVDFESEYNTIKNLSLSHPHIFNSDNFILPIIGGKINKNKFYEDYKELFVKNSLWLSNSIKYYNILNKILSSNNEVYQIVYDRGKKITNCIGKFLGEMYDIKKTLDIANKNGFYFDDLKLDNLIFQNDKIKIIDYSPIININLFEDISNQISKSKFSFIYYYPYEPISNILLYESIKKINLIGNINTGKNYYSILYMNCMELRDNLKYKLILLKNLYEICNKYIPTYSISIDLINFNFSESQKYNDEKSLLHNINNLLETKIINIKHFIYSIEYMLIFDKNNKSKNRENQINSMILNYKKNLKKIFLNNENKIIPYLLRKININSFGFIFIEWLYKNHDFDYNNYKLELKNIFDLIILSCTNIIIIDNNYYFSF